MRQQQGRPRWRRYPSPTKGAKTTSLSDVEDRALPPSKALLHCPQGVGGGHYRACRGISRATRSTEVNEHLPDCARSDCAPNPSDGRQVEPNATRVVLSTRVDALRGTKGDLSALAGEFPAIASWSPFVPPPFLSQHRNHGRYIGTSFRCKTTKCPLIVFRFFPIYGVCVPEKSHNRKIACRFAPRMSLCVGISGALARVL